MTDKKSKSKTSLQTVEAVMYEAYNLPAREMIIDTLTGPRFLYLDRMDEYNKNRKKISEKIHSLSKEEFLELLKTLPD